MKTPTTKDWLAIIAAFVILAVSIALSLRDGNINDTEAAEIKTNTATLVDEIKDALTDEAQTEEATE